MLTIITSISRVSFRYSIVEKIALCALVYRYDHGFLHKKQKHFIIEIKMIGHIIKLG